jgi:hypothetical protein
LSSMFLSRDLSAVMFRMLQGCWALRASSDPSAEERDVLQQKTTAG